jgi:hypothetical protein
MIKMHITIRIIYKGYSSRLMQRASFPVNAFEFEINPDKEAARVANEWIKQIRREIHVEEILEVIYDDNKDITELVKALEKALLDK